MLYISTFSRLHELLSWLKFLAGAMLCMYIWILRPYYRAWYNSKGARGGGEGKPRVVDKADGTYASFHRIHMHLCATVRFSQCS